MVFTSSRSSSRQISLARPKGFEPPTLGSEVPLATVRRCSMSSKLLDSSITHLLFSPPESASVQRRGCQIGCHAQRGGDDMLQRRKTVIKAPTRIAPGIALAEAEADAKAFSSRRLGFGSD